ncbi:hypothetical protein ACP4OV_013489 [Aristida adscensionis]
MASEGSVRRIVDYLNDGEELGAEGAAAAPPPARLRLPAFRWPRVVRLRRKGGAAAKGKVVVVVEEEEAVPEKGEQAAVSTSVCESAASSGTRHSDLGVGLGLVFLLAKTSDEFSKMAKVRTEMEALLREIKDQVRETSTGNNGHGAAEPRDRESTTTSSCVTDGKDRSVSARLEDLATSSGATTEMVSCEKSFEGGDCCGRMDVLEEEFRAELERLQVNYESDTSSFPPEEDEHDSEPSDAITEYRQEFSDETEEFVEDVENDDDDCYEAGYNGVSALELERRLHELLHERNRERIEELEAALRRAEKKLAERELEVCLWKDTAKFALRHENESL